MKRILKLSLLMLSGLLLLIQLLPKPEKNQSTAISAADITKSEILPDQTLQIIKTSCYDCHSNHTEYPWYYRIQPVAWWLNHHIEEGKEELNFSEWGAYPPEKKYHKLEEIEEQVSEGEMPPSSYVLMHQHAALDKSQQKIIANWTIGRRNELRKTAYKEQSDAGK